MYKPNNSCKLQPAGRRTRKLDPAKFKKLIKSKSRILLFSPIRKNWRKREKTKQNKKNPKDHRDEYSTPSPPTKPSPSPYSILSLLSSTLSLIHFQKHKKQKQ